MNVETKLNVTKHALERWVERVLEKPKDEINLYITQNRDALIENINETISYAEFIYKGQLGTDNITRHYYIKDDIVLLTNTDNNAIITVYKVDLGFTPELNSTVRKGLLEEVRKLREQKEEIEFETLVVIDKKEFEVTQVDENIKLLQKQIDELKKQKELLKSEVSLMKSKSKYTDQELNKYVLMLVNSIEYKKDIQAI